MATLRHLQTRITVTGSNIIPNWYGDQLQLTGSNTVEVGQYPPSGASQGSLWWDTDEGNLFLYYEYVSESLSQSAWVPAVSLEVENPVAEQAISASFAITASYIDVTGSNVLVNWFGSQLQLTGSYKAAVTVDNAPPSTPDQGQLWWDTDDGNLYIYYEFVSQSINYSAWVPATSLEVVTADSASIAQTASYVDISGDGIEVNYFGSQIQLTGSNDVFMDTVPPLNPINGNLWWDTDDGNMYVWYDDGSSQQWVPAVSLTLQSVSADTAISASYSNFAATASYIDIVGNGIQVNYFDSQIQLTGSAGTQFPYTGSAGVSGSIEVDGPIYSNKEVEAQAIVLKNGTTDYRFIPSASFLSIEKFDGSNWVSVGAMF